MPEPAFSTTFAADEWHGGHASGYGRGRADAYPQGAPPHAAHAAGRGRRPGGERLVSGSRSRSRTEPGFAQSRRLQQDMVTAVDKSDEGDGATGIPVRDTVDEGRSR